MLLLVAATLVAATVAVPAAWLARGSTTTFLLGAYVLATVELAGIAIALSQLGRLGRTGYLVSIAVLFVCAALAAALRRPPWPSAHAALDAAREAFRDHATAVLGGIVALELVYAALLGLLTAPNDDDALAYHLARPAFWLQQGYAGYIPGGEDVRIDAFPPLAEVVDTFVLAVGGDDRFVGAVSLTAALALVTATYAVARRIGLPRPQAAFGALLVATFPVVAFQAQSALNDLPLAAFVVAAFALVLERTTPALALAAGSVALALSTKVTAILALVPLAPLTLWSWRPRLRVPLVAGAVALALGSTWYVVNLAHTGDPFGDFPADQRGGTHPAVTITRTAAIALNLFEVPGAHGSDALVFPLAAAVGAALALATAAGRRGRRTLLPAALVVGAAPLVLPLGELLRRGVYKAWLAVGWSDVGYVDPDRDRTVASTLQSGVGALGLLATLAGLVLAVSAVRRGRMPRLVALLAAAPLAWIVLVGLAVAYFPWNARFTLAGFALAGATWGLLLERRALAWGAVGLAAVSLFVGFANLREKPSGLTLFERDRPRTALLPVTRASVFGLPRWRVQATRRDVAPVLRFLEERVPGDARVAAWPFFFPEDRDAYAAGDLLPYLLFGRSHGRHVALTTSPSSPTALRSGWYLAPSAALPAGCVDGWTTVFSRPQGWTILQRAPARGC